MAGPQPIRIGAFAVLGDRSLLPSNGLIWLEDCVLLPIGGFTVLATSMFPPPMRTFPLLEDFTSLPPYPNTRVEDVPLPPGRSTGDLSSETGASISLLGV